ncbi:hypothetical protein [Oligosphaera ethanolica]|uniref:Uncharacterized protein n=1 Tax=Oligosphaera ethanolica TaxID=760260 RepID=A0AAE4AQM4_9BACT|nr:hypothetical protein [Oligosphaera ethanolica]MDQ0291731.1 hypothetical protein [Oligosphaera ethanolica]
MYTPALRWDNLPETHGQSPHIWEANQAASFIGVYNPALRWDNLPETHGQSPHIWEANQAASFIGVVDNRLSCSLLLSALLPLRGLGCRAREWTFAGFLRRRGLEARALDFGQFFLFKNKSKN